MGERPDQVRRPAIGEDPDFDPATGAFDPDVTRTHAFDEEVLHPDTATGPEAAPAATSSVEIERSRAEIERTRADMSETVDAIQGRLAPENIKEQAKDAVKEATVGKAKGAGNSIVETVKENPLPAAITGLSLGWILMQARKRSTASASAVRVRTTAGSYPVAYDRVDYVEGHDGPPVGGTVSRARDRVGETASHAQDKVGEGAARVQQGAQDTADRTKEKASQLGQRTKYNARRASDGFGRMLRENPLAVGALAAGLGAAVGLAIPETSKENEVMGEARDNLVDKAQEKASEAQDKVQQVAQEAQSAAKNEAENQGLTNG
jgi:ElaB/YqjD/DUF883 family membrane-anchored ribosome-binding protein